MEIVLIVGVFLSLIVGKLISILPVTVKDCV